MATKKKPAKKPAKKIVKKPVKKAVKKAAKKAAPKAAKKAAPKKKRKLNPALMVPIQPDELLSVIVGSKPLPRSQMTKKLWVYIKKNDLQDKKVRTMIIADANLKPIFGGKKTVSMFEMTKLVNQHVS